MKLKPERLLLFGTILYIFLVILSYRNAWMLPEDYPIKSGILKAGKLFGTSDLKLIFDWQLFEGVPRNYRPWSSLFEIVDTRFRSLLWHFFVPHPSFSLTWLFTLGLGPFLLYRFLRLRGVSETPAVCAICLYLASPGTLSLSAMLFRPAKPMTGFAIILCFYLAERYREKLRVSFKFYAGLLGLIFLSFLWDETALLLFPAFFLFFYDLISGDRRRLLAFFSLPVLAYLTYFSLIPAITAATGHPQPALGSYFSPTNVDFSALHLGLLWGTVQRLIADSLGLADPRLLPSGWQKAIVVSAFISSCGLLSGVLFHIRKQTRLWGLLLVSILSLVAAGVLDNFLLGANQNFHWGLYYYGAYWTVFFSIFAAACLEMVLSWKGLGISATTATVLSLLLIFPYTNQVYKYAENYSDKGVVNLLIPMFENRLNRFRSPLEERPNLFGRTRTAWSDINRGKQCDRRFVDELGELSYLCVEVKP